MKQGWEIKKLGEVCTIGDGNYSSKYPKASEFISKGVPFLTATNLKNGIIVQDGMRYISNEQHLTLTKGHVRENDLAIVVRGSSTGNNSIISDEYDGSNLNSQLAYLRVKNNEIDSKYLFCAFNSPDVQKAVINAISGAAQPQLPNNKLLNIEIPVPPINEQQFIVTTLERAFASIAKAKEIAEQNLKNAKELFESYLELIFINRNKKLEEKSLGEICEIKPPKSEVRNKLKKTDSVSFVPMEDLGINQKLFNPTKERPLCQVEGSYTYFANEDVLLAKITPCFENGKLGIARRLKNGIGFGSSEFIVFRVPEYMDTEFLYYFLLRSKFRKEGSQRMMGAVGHKRVSKEFIDNYSIPIPSLEEQKIIVKKLDALSSETKKLETIYQQKLNDLEELKKSVLQKAFNGELRSA